MSTGGYAHPCQPLSAPEIWHSSKDWGIAAWRLRAVEERRASHKIGAAQPFKHIVHPQLPRNTAPLRAAAPLANPLTPFLVLRQPLYKSKVMVSNY